MMTMWDAGIILIMAVSSLIGLSRGIIQEAFSLMRWVVGFGLAKYYAADVGKHLPESFRGTLAGFVVAFIVIFIILLVLGSLLRALVVALHLGSLDRVSGILFGAVRGLLICVMLIVMAGMTTFPQEAEWQNSKLIPYVMMGFDQVKLWLPESLLKLIQLNK